MPRPTPPKPPRMLAEGAMEEATRADETPETPARTEGGIADAPTADRGTLMTSPVFNPVIPLGVVNPVFVGYTGIGVGGADDPGADSAIAKPP